MEIMLSQLLSRYIYYIFKKINKYLFITKFRIIARILLQVIFWKKLLIKFNN
jgi:hypothetical protein